MSKKGFTLMELLAVILILAILALLILPVVNKIVEGARDSANQRSVEGYIGDLNYAIMEKVLLEKNDKIYDGNGVTEFSDLEYNDIIECDFYNVKDGVIQYAEACTKKDDSWGAFYNYRIGEGAKKVRVLGRSADITGIKVNNTLATNDKGTFRITIDGVRKPTIELLSNEPVTYTLKKDGKQVSNNGKITLKDGENNYEITVTSENGKKTKKYTLVVTGTNIPNVIEGESILQILRDEDFDDGIYTFEVNDVSYPVRMYTYSGNQTWTAETIPMPDGFGVLEEVATANTEAQNMVIVKVDGDLTNETTIKPIFNGKFGGPKGFLLYVTGKLTNNGTIDNSYGTKAAGQNVYLWKNADGSYEQVDAEGGPGADGVHGTGVRGKTPAAAEGRKLAGGGSGGIDKYYTKTTSAGGAGTSYAGGSGSNGVGYATSTGAYRGGGLLVIYADGYENTGSIIAKGSAGGATNIQGAGGSGGGSINIFTNQNTGINQLGIVTDTRYSEISGTVQATGGAGGRPTQTSHGPGGAGGTGSVNIGEIRNGTYYDLHEIIEQDKVAYEENTYKTGESILAIMQNNTFTKEDYHIFRVNGEEYQTHVYVYNGNQNWTTETIPKPNGFGDNNDVSTQSGESAKNMVIVVVNGNLTNSATIKPYSGSFGGPKGFMLYVTGKLTNNGTISNNTGAKETAGQNVYLWRNADGSYEQIDAEGGAGGAGRSGIDQEGATPAAATGRNLAGGGSGGIGSYLNYYSSATGGTGSSYSSGYGTAGKEFEYSAAGASNCAGLLIVYANQYTNTGSITANGTNGSAQNAAGGGGSGGGSVNIFTNQSNITPGTVQANGGKGGHSTQTGRHNGGNGGAGTVNIGRIVNGSYVAN